MQSYSRSEGDRRPTLTAPVCREHDVHFRCGMGGGEMKGMDTMACIRRNYLVHGRPGAHPLGWRLVPASKAAASVRFPCSRPPFIAPVSQRSTHQLLLYAPYDRVSRQNIAASATALLESVSDIEFGQIPALTHSFSAALKRHRFRFAPIGLRKDASRYIQKHK